ADKEAGSLCVGWGFGMRRLFAASPEIFLYFFILIMISSSWREYCEQTSLHGWFYIGSDKPVWRIIWLLIVAASIGIASIFIYEAVDDFTKSTVVTTIHSTTVPLSEVYFLQ
ncbi:Uncharacterized protein FKW44_020902, partial [Caligus rogercresseyi]